MKKRCLPIVFSLFILLLILSGCTIPEIMAVLPQLSGYWRYEDVPIMYGDGFIHIIQNNDQITMRFITENTEKTEMVYTLKNPGLIRERERYFNTGLQLLSGEVLPAGTYTTIEKQVSDITNNEIKIFQEFEYILHNGVEKCYAESNERGSYIRSLKPKSISEWLRSYSPQLTVSANYKDFVAGEIYDINFDLIPDEELPNTTTEGTITLTSNQKTFVLSAERVTWFNVFSLVDYEELKFILLFATHPDFKFITACHNNNGNINVIEGAAFADQAEIGVVVY